MFGLFSSKPPLTTRQRTELELLFRKCVALVGDDEIREADVIAQCSDLALDLSDQDALMITAAAEVRRRMKLTDANVQLKITDYNTIEAAACYQKGSAPMISVATETAQDPLRTVTALAHEYSHHILLSGEPVKAADYDERLTDLLPVCFGFGVLQSDASLYSENWSVGEWSGWQVSQAGYLNAQEIGYALALFARVRSESKPRWKRWLRADSAVTLKQTLKYFAKLKKSDRPLLFDADRIPDAESASRELVAWLTGDDPTFALAAAWRLCALDKFDTTTLEALHAATHASDPDVVPVVIGLLAGADERDEKTVARVTALLRDRRPTVALAAAKAAYALGLDLKDQMGTLAWLLDKYKQEPFEVLTMIAAQGPSASAIDGTLCHMLPRSIKSLNDDLTLALVNCLRSISDNPKQSIESCLSAGPIRDEAIQWLQRSG